MAATRKFGRIVRFGRFEADLEAGQLRKNGRKVKLQDQPFRLLCALLEQPGRVVSRAVLRHELWADDTFVDFDQGLAAAINRVRKALGDRSDRPRFVETVPRRGYRFLAAVETVDLAPATEPIGVAVLPFANISPDPDDEYFSDGLTEELIHALTMVKGLRVTSSASTFAFKGKRPQIQEVAEKLKVKVVLEGSVRKDGENLRVTAQLIDATENFHLWSRAYDRKLDEVFLLQEEIARGIIRAVRSEVVGETAEVRFNPPTQDLDAYRLYLKGRHFWNQRRRDSLEKGLGYFQQAIATDPRFALAHAGVADSFVFLAVYGGYPMSRTISQAEEAAREALAIDAKLPEAHIALGMIRVAEHDFPAAYAAFKHALELNPGLARAHHFCAMALAVLGRLEEALEEIRRALELDPLAVTANQDAGRISYFARRYDDAIQHFQDALEIDPEFTLTRRCLGVAYLQKSMFREALAAFSSDPTMSAATHALTGESDPARALVEEMSRFPRRKHYQEAILHVSLGNNALAIAALESAYDSRPHDFSDHHDHLLVLGVDPLFDSLRSHPRFARLAERVRATS